MNTIVSKNKTTKNTRRVAIMMDELLKLLEKEKNVVSRAKFAQMLGISEEEVATKIETLEKENVIAGYKTLINWDKTDREVVNALIELKVTPQKGGGFDLIAKKIYNYPQVKSLFLMSGAYDLAVTIEGSTMREVAMFVAQNLAPMDEVLSTATHFVLKKYKEEGIVFEENEKDARQMITI